MIVVAGSEAACASGHGVLVVENTTMFAPAWPSFSKLETEGYALTSAGDVAAALVALEGRSVRADRS